MQSSGTPSTGAPPINLSLLHGNGNTADIEVEREEIRLNEHMNIAVPKEGQKRAREDYISTTRLCGLQSHKNHVVGNKEKRKEIREERSFLGTKNK